MAGVVHRRTLLRLRGGAQAETYEFGADMSQLMSLIVNSFYSSKEIFLRELLSNSADAIDKFRHRSLTEGTPTGDSALQISLIPDAEAGTLTVVDNGVGMTREELRANLGTIAHSGTKAFMRALQDGQADGALIGQFGVGFYSAFLVADRVEVYSRSDAQPQTHKWESDAGGKYTIEEAEYPGLTRGSAVVLHLKEEEKDLLRPTRLRAIVKQHSEFVQHPIRLWEPLPPQGADGGGGEEPEAAPRSEWSILNEQPPIWMQRPSELTDTDYAKFYKGLTNPWSDYMAVKHFEVEGQVGMRGLLYVPKEPPFDIFDQLAKGKGLRLYVRRVLVMDKCDELCPEWLGFLRGVIDSDDLPLNVSREMLQHSSRLLRLLRRHVVRKALEMMNELAADEEKYAGFYDSYAKNLKLGVHEDEASREKLAALLRFRSSKSAEGATSLAQYVDRMVAGQEDIFYIAAESVEAAANSPFMEAFNQRGIEVLYMVDPIDEYALQSYPEHQGHRFVCITKEGVQLPGSADDGPAPEDRAAVERLCEAMGRLLSGRVAKVALSERLSQSPCVLLTAEHGWSANMERIMRAQAMSDTKAMTAMRSQRTLEINPAHPIIRSLASHVAAGEAADGDQVLERSVELLYEAALLSSGFVLESTSGFLSRVHQLLERDLAASGQPPAAPA
ncbi:hypothetical protein AB1Y20_004188 [Prymnesium parvum]|uniref:Histidine kinase/HSP90-like ATPase domain-containing protein n=1 Tax=Prymnesium parvum TaxID=97485 RepID=A0AB34J7F5_PRYPA